MAWVATDRSEQVFVYESKPERNSIYEWWDGSRRDGTDSAELSENACKILIGKVLTWEDEPVEI